MRHILLAIRKMADLFGPLNIENRIHFQTTVLHRNIYFFSNTKREAREKETLETLMTKGKNESIKWTSRVVKLQKLLCFFY